VEKMESGNLASGAIKQPTHMRGILHQSYVQKLRFHAYAWTSVSHSRICVSQEHRVSNAHA
ncbi:hypothetical protein PIB30_112372, partial [Stylosanthes scabra]|nr:hypothetical protein [Stylosanthes scabra]